MKKILTILLLGVVLNGFGQEIRGHLVKINTCEFIDSGGYKILKSRPYHETFAKITQDKFYVKGDNIHIAIDLYDKQVDSSDKDNWVVHFIGKFRKKIYIVAVKECEGLIMLAMFPTNSSDKFYEYVIKPRKDKTEKIKHSD